MFLYNDNILAENIFMDNIDTGYIVLSNGNIIGKRFNKPLNASFCKEGYQQVKLCFDKSEKNVLVHRLVAEAFIPNPENKPEVNHKDGDKTHNYIENLEWVTREENIQHAFRLGLKKALSGEDHPLSTNTEKSIHMVCELLEENVKSIQEISSITNVTVDVIRQVQKKKTWKNISDLYNVEDYSVDGRRMFYTLQQLILVCKSLEENKLTRKEIKNISGVKITTINGILRKKIYKNISVKFNILNYTIDNTFASEIYTDDYKNTVMKLITEGFTK